MTFFICLNNFQFGRFDPYVTNFLYQPSAGILVLKNLASKTLKCSTRISRICMSSRNYPLAFKSIQLIANEQKL